MYRGLYKCRMCEARFYGENSYATEGEAISSIKIPNGMYKVHHCIDGGLGIADFLGFRWRVDGDDELEQLRGHIGFKCNKCGKIHVLSRMDVFASKDRMFPCVCGGFVVATYKNAYILYENGEPVKIQKEIEGEGNGNDKDK